jgi:uncharacterized repeat protein (TIGR04138 family)
LLVERFRDGIMDRIRTKETRFDEDLALQMYGVMAQVVLEHWGVRSTSDIGDIVFVLVDLGYLISQPTDNRADFIGVYQFDRAFEHEYPWSAAALV